MFIPIIFRTISTYYLGEQITSELINLVATELKHAKSD